MKIPKKFFVLEMANNHMGDVNHGLQMIEQFSKVTKKYPFKFGFKLQYRDLNTFIHKDLRNRNDMKFIKRFNETKLTEKDFWDFRLPQINTRTADIQYLLDELEVRSGVVQSPWEAMDLDRIGIFGHSYGGATSVMASYLDNRIDACISLI